jgi:hypothetical protein
VAALLLVQGRWRGLLLIVGLATLLYLPWAARAMVYTHTRGQVGNPVFPIAAQALGRGHWSDEQVECWARGHAPQGERRTLPEGGVERAPITLAGRLAVLVRETLRDPQWSPGVGRMADWTRQPGQAEPPAPVWAKLGLIWLVVPLVLVLAATRGLVAWKLLLVLVVQMLGWLFFTHLQARFLLPAIIPMALLFGLAAEAFLVPRAIIIGFVSLNAALCAFLLIPEARLFGGGPPGLPIGRFYSLPQGWSAVERPFSDAALEEMKICLIGPPMATPLYLQTRYVYNTVWDRSPLAGALRQSPAAAMAWLRQNGCNFVAVDWNEVERLRGTYGFDPILTREHIAELRDHGLKLANKTYVIRPGIELYEVEEALKPAADSQTAPGGTR